MPEYRCKDCGAVWYVWGAGKVCPKCGGKLELVTENDTAKNEAGPPQGWAEGFRN